MREADFRVCRDIGLQVMPLSTAIADVFAGGADRQQTTQGAHFCQRLVSFYDGSFELGFAHAQGCHIRHMSPESAHHSILDIRCVGGDAVLGPALRKGYVPFKLLGLTAERPLNVRKVQCIQRTQKILQSHAEH